MQIHVLNGPLNSESSLLSLKLPHVFRQLCFINIHVSQLHCMFMLLQLFKSCISKEFQVKKEILLHVELLVSCPELVYDPKYRSKVTNHHVNKISETAIHLKN